MKRKIVKIASMVLAMMLVSANIAFASDSLSTKAEIRSEEDDAIQPRSLYLSTGISEITNEGNGTLHIYADFTANNSVKWAKLTIKLERRKSATSGSWSNVKTYTYEFNEEDEPDGRLTFAYADFDVTGFATDYYYRVTCEHKVQTPSGSYETKTTRTDGVLLTSYPDFRSIGGEN